MITTLKFLALVIVLNIVRYLFAYVPLEHMITLPMFSVMSENPSYFNTNFTPSDWATSFFYNFMMWLTCAWVFMLMHPRLKGHMVVRALKVYGLMFLMFASISAIYMNHYSHPREFYYYSILDSLLVFPWVAVATGLLWPLFFKPIAHETH
ncbi:MAG: hypothetical protein L0Y80_10065 [Ignavibacteriae bacterium]|nr:hypothetical protein [Ignavibacteriota bacterium]